MKFSIGDYYEGEFLKGKKHGKGIYKYANGDKYEGEFKEGIREGFGEFLWNNGENFKGQWIGDKITQGEFGENFGQGFEYIRE